MLFMFYIRQGGYVYPSFICLCLSNFTLNY